MPTPRPDTSVTCLAVEKPGARIKEKISASRKLGVGGNQPFLDGARADGFASMPLHRRRRRSGRWRPRAAPKGGWCRGRRLPAATAVLGRLDAVVHAVADEVHQGIVQLVDHGLVQFRIGALNGEFDFLVQIPRQVVDEPAEALEGALESAT